MAKVKKKYETAASDWQTAFCALSIILVAFFVMLCSMATMEQGKIIEVRRSFRGALMIFSGGVLFEEGEGIVVPSPDRMGHSPDKIATPIFHLLKGKGLQDTINLKTTSEFVSLTLLDTLAFEAGTAELSASVKPILSEIALILSDFSVPIKVEGHTDDMPEDTGIYRTDWEMSAMRAISVMNILKSEGNIPSENISATGFAKYRPFVPNRTETERKRNRRVEIIIPVVHDFFERRDSIIRDAPPSFKAWDLSG